MLKLGKTLELPDEAVTQTFGVLAVRGAGKSNLGAVMAEEMFTAGLPFVAIDPVGSWWGLRASQDGKGAGFAVPIFGGQHGDVPLARSHGNMLADLIVDERLSCVVDLTDFESENARKAFLLDFARRLYRKNQHPLHLFLEEADDYIPQRPQRDEVQLVRAWENIVRRGRSRGLGMTLITQRSAAINKNVLTQVETLFVLRTTGPQDRKAVEAWVKYQGAKEEMLGSLSGLENGEAWCWSPHWLGKMERTRIRRRRTFDSGATPAHGGKAPAPSTLADIDLGALQEAWSEAIEQVADDDPKALRKRIAELEAELKKKGSTQHPLAHDAAADVRTWLGKLRQAHADVESIIVRAVEHAERLDKLLGRATVDDTLDPYMPKRAAKNDRASRHREAIASFDRASRHRGAIASFETSTQRATGHPIFAKLGPGERAILVACVEHDSTVPRGCTRAQLSVLTGYKRSTRDAYIQRLTSKGLVTVERVHVVATEKGLASVPEGIAPLPTGDALREQWLNRLPSGEAIILASLCAAYPKRVARGEIDARYRRSTRDAYIQRLATRKLVIVTREGVQASPHLFEP